MDKNNYERFEAAVLGHSLRQRLVHSVREEYTRIVQEVEGGNDSPLACKEIHWPMDHALCFPVLIDSSFTHSSLTVGHASSGTDESPAVQQQRFVETIENGTRGGGTKSQHSELDTRSSRHTADAMMENDTTVVDTQQMDKKPSLQSRHSHSEHPFPTECDRDKDDSMYSQLGSDSPTLGAGLQPTTHCSTSVQLRTQTAGECSLESRGSLLVDGPKDDGGDAAFAEGDCKWMDFLCPVPSDLPSDRKSLLELRAQLAMELLWIKQAIASRQKYLKLKTELSCQQE